jgi:ABC-type transporter Mla subunit MlaD
VASDVGGIAGVPRGGTRVDQREYQRGLATLSAAGTTFAELAEKVSKDVEALPDPAERLIGLWDGVRSLERTLTSSIGGASEELETLAQRSAELSTALVKLERTTGSAAGNIERGGAELGETLRRELTQMNQLLEEYTRLFERKVASSGSR